MDTNTHYGYGTFAVNMITRNVVFLYKSGAVIDDIMKVVWY